MSDQSLPRREFVGALGTGVAAVWLSAGVHRDAIAASVAAARTPGASVPFRFAPADRRDIEALTEIILPSDGTAGAKEAEVMTFIEACLGTFASAQQPLFAAGIVELNGLVSQMAAPGKRFADLSAADQLPYVQAMDADRTEFYEAVRTATLTGFLADPSYGGNKNKVGWELVGFVDQYVWQPPFGYYDDVASR